MKLPWLKSALEQDGPILSVYLDTTRTDPNAAAELSIRWEQLRTQMVSEGAPTALLDDIHRTVQLPQPIWRSAWPGHFGIQLADPRRPGAPGSAIPRCGPLGRPRRPARYCN